MTIAALRRATAELAEGCRALRFGPPVACIYRPLDYAGAVHDAYLERYGQGPKRVLLLGMNPGPFGMVQTGIPFGEVAAVRDWLGLAGPVKTPAKVHPKRAVQGFACRRSEVSGRRLWGLFAERFGTPETFFREHYVANWCPLAFVGASGANLTPDKLAAPERQALAAVCDTHLARLIEVLQPQVLAGVGGFAAKRLALVAPQARTIQLLHPSPASPAANRGWAAAVTAQLVAAGVWD